MGQNTEIFFKILLLQRGCEGRLTSCAAEIRTGPGPETGPFQFLSKHTWHSGGAIKFAEIVTHRRQHPGLMCHPPVFGLAGDLGWLVQKGQRAGTCRWGFHTVTGNNKQNLAPVFFCGEISLITRSHERSHAPRATSTQRARGAS